MKEILSDKPKHNAILELEETYEYFLEAAEFEAQIERSNIPSRITQVLDRVMARLPQKGEEISKVLMVGGSSKLPWVKRFVGNYFGSSRLVDNFDPSKAVAEGAALEASWLAKRFRGEATSKAGKVINSIPRSLGTCAIKDGKESLDVIIPRASHYPVSETTMYYAVSAVQKDMLVEVIEGDDLTPGKCKETPNLYLGDYLVPLQRTDVAVNVEFRVDANGMLEVLVSQEGTSVSIADTLSKKVGKAMEEASLSPRELVACSQMARALFKAQYAMAPSEVLQTFVHREIKGDNYMMEDDEKEACKEYISALKQAPKQGSSGALLRIFPKAIRSCDSDSAPAASSGDPSCWLPAWKDMRDDLFTLSGALNEETKADLADAQWSPILQALLQKQPSEASVEDLNKVVNTSVQDLANIAVDKSCPKELGYQFAVLQAISASRDSFKWVE